MCVLFFTYHYCIIVCLMISDNLSCLCIMQSLGSLHFGSRYQVLLQWYWKSVDLHKSCFTPSSSLVFAQCVSFDNSWNNPASPAFSHVARLLYQELFCGGSVVNFCWWLDILIHEFKPCLSLLIGKLILFNFIMHMHMTFCRMKTLWIHRL